MDGLEAISRAGSNENANADSARYNVRLVSPVLTPSDKAEDLANVSLFNPRPPDHVVHRFLKSLKTVR